MKVKLLPPLLERFARNKVLRVSTPRRSPHPVVTSVLILSGDLITQVDGKFWHQASSAERDALIAAHNARLKAMTARLGAELAVVRRRLQWLIGLPVSGGIAALYFQYGAATPGEGGIAILFALWMPAALGALSFLTHRFVKWRVGALVNKQV